MSQELAWCKTTWLHGEEKACYCDSCYLATAVARYQLTYMTTQSPQSAYTTNWLQIILVICLRFFRLDCSGSLCMMVQLLHSDNILHCNVV